jgi:hypothetical protein
MRWAVFSILLVLCLSVFVSAESVPESYLKFDSITVKFVDSLTSSPIQNSEIEVFIEQYEGLNFYAKDDNYAYYNPDQNLFPEGSYTLEEVMSADETVRKTKLKLITNSSGEITIPIESGAVTYSLRSDRADNIHYVNQGDSMLISVLEKPEFIVYLSPIFDLEVNLETDFNFLFSFFRRFRYGSYLKAPSSELNMDSVIEPSCFMRSLQKGETVGQYSKTIPLQVYLREILILLLKNLLSARFMLGKV